MKILSLFILFLPVVVMAHPTIHIEGTEHSLAARDTTKKVDYNSADGYCARLSPELEAITASSEAVNYNQPVAMLDSNGDVIEVAENNLDLRFWIYTKVECE